jgi:1-acyl-sn-glycerol-3-phosphate acyltransferase
MRKTPEPPRRFTWPHYTFARTCALPGLYHALGGWRVFGRENVPRTGGALIAGNHISFIDPPTIGAALPRRTYYFAKKELFEVPVFGAIIRKCYAFPVEREIGDREAVRNAINILKSGELLVIFPEGGRSPDGTLQEGNVGAALIASRAGVPIVPVAVRGTDKALPLHAKFLHRAKLSVMFGEPLYPEGEKMPKEQLQELTDRLMASIADLQARLEAAAK